MPYRGMRLVAVAATLAVALPAHAGARIGWVHAEGYAQQRRHPARYYPGNLVDGDRRKVTCFPAGATGQARHSVTIGIRGTARFTAVRVDNGDQSRAHVPRSHHRVRELILETNHATQTLTLPDTDAPQVVRFGTPVDGDHVTVIIKSAYGHGGLVCLSGLTFMQRRFPLVARDMRYDRHRARLQGLWAAGPEGAPERFLALYYDGSYRWTYLPNDPDARHRSFGGAYSVRGRALTLQVPGRRVRLRFRLERQAAGGRDAFGVAGPAAGKTRAAERRRLVLTGGKRLPEHLAGHYRDQWL